MIILDHKWPREKSKFDRHDFTAPKAENFGYLRNLRMEIFSKHK